MSSLKHRKAHFCLVAALALGAITLAKSQITYSADFASSSKVDADIDKDAIDQCLQDAKNSGQSKECEVSKSAQAKHKSKETSTSKKITLSIKKETKDGKDIYTTEGTSEVVEKCIKCNIERSKKVSLNTQSGDLDEIAKFIRLKTTEAGKIVKADLKEEVDQFNAEEKCEKDPDGEALVGADKLTCLHDKMAEKSDDDKRKYFEANIRPMIDAQLADTTNPQAALMAKALLSNFADVGAEGALKTEMQALSVNADIKIAPAIHANDLNQLKMKLNSALAANKGNPTAIKKIQQDYQSAVAASNQTYVNQNVALQTQLTTMQSNPKNMLDPALASSIGSGLTALNANSVAFQAEIDAQKTAQKGKRFKNGDDKDTAAFEHRIGRLSRDADQNQKSWCKMNPGACNEKVTLVPLAAGKNGATIVQKNSTTVTPPNTNNLGVNARSGSI
jgi:hypothetical protein